MAIANPFAITYGTRKVGGATEYQLHGPYVFDKSYDTIRLVFDVVVVGTSYSNLQSLADDIETDFRKRLTSGQTLVIDLDGSSWTYTHGSTILNTRASLSKAGDPDTDKGYSRAYTCVIEGELPADNDNGLRDVEVLVDYEAGRQKTVTMRGTYTAYSGSDAVTQYQADFDAEATSFLTAIDNSATFELVDETYTLDREMSGGSPDTHVCNFTRQYLELLANQTQSALDDGQIRDHRVVFTDLSQHPGDSKESIYRLRRVVGSYDCAIDIEQTTNLQTVFSTKVKPHVQALFQQNFNPQVFAIEDRRVSYDETTKRLSVSIQFLYQTPGGDKIVEVSQSVAFRENRQIDYTYTHGKDEFGANTDVGFATLERVWTRTVVALGEDSPKLRIAEGPKQGAAGPFADRIGGHTGPDAGGRRPIVAEGWNIVSNTSQVTPQWIGDPDGTQIQVVVVSETVVERYNRRPGVRTSTPIQRAITP